jgi:hypothetical protein
MRKIDKSVILATEYDKWVASFDENNQDHPKYDSSRNKYYNSTIKFFKLRFLLASGVQ